MTQQVLPCLLRHRSAVFSKDGGLLWYNQACWGGPASLEVLAGFGWTRFVHPTGRDAILWWVQHAQDGDGVGFQIRGAA